MDQTQPPFVKITQSRVFQVSMSAGMFTLVLLHGEYVSEAMEPFIKIPVNGPLTMYRMPAHTWRTLWPEKIEPPGWLNVRHTDGHIVLTPDLSTSRVGGIIAYMSQDESVPVNGITTVTCINCPHPKQSLMSADIQNMWQGIWTDIEPRFPPQSWENASIRTYVLPTTIVPAEQLKPSGGYITCHRDAKMIGGFIGSGIGIAILAAILIVLVARYVMLKTT
jgi:hypothetical protein